MDEKRIISGGRTQYQPIKDNETSESKWGNRRTDIILNPNLERMLDITTNKT